MSTSDNTNLFLIKELRGKLNQSIVVEDNASEKIAGKPKIQKVPASLRSQKKSEKYYEPRWMSIGPIHHGNTKYRLAEEYKLGLVARFIRSGGYEAWEDLYELIADRMAGMGQWYSEDTTRAFGDPRDIEWLLFFDGCAVIQFVYGYSGGDYLGMKNDQVAFTMHDIFLLENQIPFRVLELLIESQPSDSAAGLRKSVAEFIGMNAMAPPKYRRRLMMELLDRDPDHLLHLLLMVLVEKPENLKRKSNPKINPPPGIDQESDKKKSEESSSDITIQIPKITMGSRRKTRRNKEQQSFRSISDLKAAGINLSPSSTSRLGDVRFTSRGGLVATLELPPVIVDDLTGSKFMNLIAYEMCPDNTATGYEVTSYISFLDSLIDYPADVKELRSARVLHNLLGCDDEVARLFNKIGTDLVPDARVYEGVIDSIERHYKKKLTTWMAQVLNDHFSTPWTIVTFLAASLALGLAVVDTWLNVKGDRSKRE